MADVKTMLVLPGKRLSVVTPIKRTFQASAGVALTCALILVLVLGNGLLMSKWHDVKQGIEHLARLHQAFRHPGDDVPDGGGDGVFSRLLAA